MRIGLIADTHGLLRPEALAALAGCGHIVHAGDIGAAAILERLRTLAPVTAVRGNNDSQTWARGLPLRTTVEVAGCVLYVVHEIADLRLHPAPPDAAAVITGHSHRPSIERRGTTLFINPGSAGPRRFKLPVSVATLQVRRGRLEGAIEELAVAPSRPRS